MLKLYPDQTNRAVLRAGTDVLILAWSALWIVMGSLARRLVESLQSTVDGLQSSGEAIKAVLGPFAHGPLNRLVGNVLSPDLGDRVVAFAGRSHAAIDRVALATAVATAAVPIVLLVVPYLIWRAGCPQDGLRAEFPEEHLGRRRDRAGADLTGHTGGVLAAPPAPDASEQRPRSRPAGATPRSPGCRDDAQPWAGSLAPSDLAWGAGGLPQSE